MKKIAYSVMILCVMLMITACGSNNEEESGMTSNLYDEIMEKGVITVGTEGTYAPFTFHNEAGELTGYDVEVFKEIAKRMGVKVEFGETQWDSMFAGLNAKRFDVIANQVGINKERLENYDFSDPYTYSSAVVVVAKDNNNINSFKKLEGKKSAQSLTSNYGAIAEENGAELVAVDGLAQAIELIKQGRVDVTVNDKLAVLNYMKQQGDKNIKIVAEGEDVSKTGYCFNKGNEKLIEVVNEQLKAMREDGTLAKISKEWFGEDVSSK